MEKDWFKKLFPNIAREMEEGVSRVQVGDEDRDEETERKKASRKWAGYEPDVVDFIRRCDTEEQAREIVDYLEERGEIAPEQAGELRKRLKSEGLISFGIRKEEDFYHKNS